MEKRKRINKRYSPEFKLSVILDMREHHLGYKETARKYGLVRQSMGGAMCTLHRWERIYLEEGESGFLVERRGRTTKMDNSKVGIPRKKPLDKSVEEDLIAENQRLKEQNEWLRMENEYLKKLDALIQAEKERNGKKPK